MAELTLERHFDADPKTVFEFVTQTGHLLEWWGPEGMNVPEHALDFSKLGPWFSIMRNSDGHNYKVSGQVTSVNPPHSVGFTWAWHDEEDNRGMESHVVFTVEAGKDGGAMFTLNHADLPDDEIAKNHEMGWTSSLIKLENYVR
jgi:uncharacterized protein YndB with AHSA1/START domain